MTGGLLSPYYGNLRYRIIANNTSVEILGIRGFALGAEVGPVQIPPHIEDLPVTRISARVFTRMDRRWRADQEVGMVLPMYTSVAPLHLNGHRA